MTKADDKKAADEVLDDDQTLVTKEGLKKLQEEHDFLKTEKRKEVAQRLKEAISYGDLSENSEYQEAKNEQAFIEGRILTLERIIGNAIIIGDDIAHSDRVQMGGHVILLNQSGDEEEYTLVGSAEADPSRGRISNESPVGKALLNKKVGEVLQVKTPAGTVTLTISSVS